MLVVLGYICPNLMLKVLTICLTLWGRYVHYLVFSVVVVKSIIWCRSCGFDEFIIWCF